MNKSDKKNLKSTPKTTSADSGCLCGCCGGVPEYEEEDFIIEEENY